MDGCQLARETRRLRPQCRIVLLTAFPTETHLPADRGGVDLVVQKPITRENLAAAIRTTSQLS